MNEGWGGGGVARQTGVAVSRVSVGFQSIASGDKGVTRIGVRRGAGEGEMSRARNLTGE